MTEQDHTAAIAALNDACRAEPGVGWVLTPGVQALGQAAQADPDAAAECIATWVSDFRDDLAKVSVPTLVIHGDSDGTVPIEVSGQRTHEAVAGSELHVVEGGPHGINASHQEEFNRTLLAFLAK